MRRQYLNITLIVFLGAILLSAQSLNQKSLGYSVEELPGERGLPPGTVVPDITWIDLDLRYHDIQSILDSGKHVILDLFWTKCSPCWDYYQSGKLQAIQNELGPNGTDQVRVFSIEAEGASLACLQGIGSCTYGNWLQNANYSVASSSLFGSWFDIEGYPAYYIVFPDRTVSFMTAPTVTSVKATMQQHPHNYSVYQNNVVVSNFRTGVYDQCLCPGDSIKAKVDIRNFGKNNITDIEFDYYQHNTYLGTYHWSGLLKTHESTEVEFPPFAFSADNNLRIIATKVNGVDDNQPSNNEVKRYINDVLVIEGSGHRIKTKLMADADRIYWEFIDHDDNVIKSGGNPLVGTNGGGQFHQNNPVPYHVLAYQDSILYEDTIQTIKPGCHRLKVVDGTHKGLHEVIDGSYIKLFGYPPPAGGGRIVQAKFKEYYFVYEVLAENIDTDQDGHSYDVDCNDQDPTIFPGATETCDGIDNNCNGLIDAEDPTTEGLLTLYADIDGDGFGNSFDSIWSCSMIEHFVENGNDCDNNNADINPNATEIPDNGIDENCDGEDLVTIFPCIAYAGRDTALCTHNGFDTIALGATPVATGGIPPYTYTWSADLDYSFLHFTASDFLHDTTVANPLLDGFLGDELIFRLDVTDSLGNTCYDSVRIQFSQYVITLDVKIKVIAPGDSALLYTSVDGGIPPLTYEWSPVTGLANPNELHTKASPDVTTTYILHIVDSAGCEIYDDFQIIVMPTGTEAIEAERFKSRIAPHPLFDQSMVSVDGPSNRPYTVTFFNLVGQPVLKSEMQQNEMIVYRKDFTPGIYFYQIATTQGIVATGKMIVN